MGFGLAYLDLTLAYSEGQHDHRNGVSPNFVGLLVGGRLITYGLRQIGSFVSCIIIIIIIITSIFITRTFSSKHKYK